LIKVTTIGFDKLSNRLSTVGKAMKAEVQAEVEASAMQFVSLAKRDLATQGGDRGTLLRSISYKKETPYSYIVSANAPYAPFIEFGTKSKFNPYPGTEEYAAQFKGTKQSGALKLIDVIAKWVKRKGIGASYNVKTRRKVRQTKKETNQIAFLIARSIFKNGISPKPFFYKQIPIVQSSLNERINRILNAI
jgi:hypothetical protein